MHLPVRGDGARRAYLAANPKVWRAIAYVGRHHLTYLNWRALADLAWAVSKAPAVGDIVEAGVALGGSAIVLAAAKSTRQRLHLYDVFGMITPPSRHDGEEVHERYQAIALGRSRGIAGGTYYGYREDLLSEVRHNLSSAGYELDENNIHLVQGDFDVTLYPRYRVAVAHLDCDWYASMRTCLERIGPHVLPGGRFVLDDYDQWSGARRAVDEYVEANARVWKPERRWRLHLVRTGINPQDGSPARS